MAAVVFKVQTTCGYTPEIAFGITMAEALLAFFSVMALFIVYLLFVIAKPAE